MIKRLRCPLKIHHAVDTKVRYKRYTINLVLPVTRDMERVPFTRSTSLQVRDSSRNQQLCPALRQTNKVRAWQIAGMRSRQAT